MLPAKEILSRAFTLLLFTFLGMIWLAAVNFSVEDVSKELARDIESLSPRPPDIKE